MRKRKPKPKFSFHTKEEEEEEDVRGEKPTARGGQEAQRSVEWPHQYQSRRPGLSLF